MFKNLILSTHFSSFSQRIVKCTRWSELSEAVSYLAEMSASLEVVSQFQLLNGADPVIIGLSDDGGESLNVTLLFLVYHFREQLNLPCPSFSRKF